MELLTQNSKLKNTSKELKIKVYNFGIPAYKTLTGKITCPFADTCTKRINGKILCYAQNGAYNWPVVKNAYNNRYLATKQDNFTELIQLELNKKKPNFVRVHDSGDFYSRQYLQKWLTIANNNKHINFYAYTNSIQFIKELTTIPENFDFIFSDAGKQVNLIDYNKDRYTKIFDTKEDLEKANFVDASKIDLLATKFYNKNNKIGLIKH